MTTASWFRALLRQTAYAAVMLSVLLILIERLAPGAVLPFLDLFWVVVSACLLSFLSAVLGVDS